MNSTTKSRIRRTIKRVVEMLVDGDYEGLEALTSGVRLRSQHIESGIAEYGKTLTYPPSSAYDNIDAIEVQGTTPTQYSIRFPLFTREEGRSDLELQATLVDENPNGPEMRVELDNIIVA